jgi:hypothetical protein
MMMMMMMLRTSIKYNMGTRRNDSVAAGAFPRRDSVRVFQARGRWRDDPGDAGDGAGQQNAGQGHARGHAGVRQAHGDDDDEDDDVVDG